MKKIVVICLGFFTAMVLLTSSNAQAHPAIRISHAYLSSNSPEFNGGAMIYSRASEQMVGQADLSIDIEDIPDPARAYNYMSYTFWMSNLGPDMATDVVLVITLPAGVSLIKGPPAGCTQENDVLTCHRTWLEVRGTIGMGFFVLVPCTEWRLVITATISANELDPYPPDNTHVEDTAVVCPDTIIFFPNIFR